MQEESYKPLRSSAVTERFATFIAREQKIWKDIARRAQIKAD